jgi:DNA-binding response OmpR family regulator
MPHILFAEDEAVLGKLVKEALEREPGFKVTWVRDGGAALAAFSAVKPDICVLDVMMPVMDGFELVKQIRLLDPDIPVMFLTARSQTADVVRGFESGAHDYLKKPFSIEELVVRVLALLRRHTQHKTTASPERYSIGAYTFIPATQSLRYGDQQYQLSGKETALLHALVQHKNGVMERKPVLLSLWGDDNFFNARNMDVYIAKLRKYLSLDDSLSIVNIRGYGFKLIEQTD